MEIFGFERLSFVQNAIQAIHGRILTSDLCSSWPTFDIALEKSVNYQDEILRVQWVAKCIAKHYRIFDTTFDLLP